MCQRRHVQLYRHSTVQSVSENSSLNNMYLGSLKIMQDHLKPELIAILLKLMLYFRVPLIEPSFTDCPW